MMKYGIIPNFVTLTQGRIAETVVDLEVVMEPMNDPEVVAEKMVDAAVIEPFADLNQPLEAPGRSTSDP